MTKPRIAIIGGGAAGTSAAAALAERGCEVTLCERDHLASGSTPLSAGVFNINSPDDLQLRVRILSRVLRDRLEKENGLPLSRIGYVRLARTAEQVDVFHSIIEKQKALAAVPSEVIGVERLLEIVPHLYVDDVVGALYDPRDGHLDPPILCNVYAERARAAGARIVQKAPVVGVGTGVGARHRLDLPNESIEADIVINAAGAWADRLGEMLGAPMPLVNQVHDVIMVRVPEQVNYTIPMVQAYNPGSGEGVYMRQEGERQLIAGMHTYDIVESLGSANPDSYRRTVDWDNLERVAQHVSERLPVEGVGFEFGWTGIYPLSADEDFVVGPYDHDDTIIALGGLGGHGVVAAPALGQTVAEWILDGEPKAIPEAVRFRPDSQRVGAMVDTAARASG
jgi:sarcosine oxidase subunit beta